MELVFEDALDIFRGWRDDSSQVVFFLDGTEALVKIFGVVSQVLADEIVVSNDAARVRLGLKQAGFQYQDSREGPHFLRQISESDFRCCIEVCLPTDSRCFIFELKKSTFTPGNPPDAKV
jgi:hypothetical protein